MKRFKRSATSAEEETLRAVLTQVLLENANTRNRIAERLGVSPMTVCTAVGKLRDSNLITEQKQATARGRHPLRIEPSDRLHSGMVCLTATEATFALCDQRNQVIERGVLPYNPTLPPEGNLAVLRQRWEACLHAHQKRDRGIGFGVILHSSLAPTEFFTRQMREILRPNVIRREEDAGVIVLIDDRYDTDRYRALFPEHWPSLQYAGNAAELAEVVAEFWNGIS